MKNIILIGMKGCGKSTVGRVLSKKLGMRFVELDDEISMLYEKKTGKRLSCRKIFRNIGEEDFRQLETDALNNVKRIQNMALSCGGGTPLSETNQGMLRSMGTVVFLDTDEDILLKRIKTGGIPSFFKKNEDHKTSLHQVLETRFPVYEKIAGVRLALRDESPEEIATHISERIGL
ncbi:MAG TPA: shikimate kinase [Patescibacteria group bacterium]|jgi:shikimate kinase|nr:shikimate kinase [Patescibacteria group bacterium]